jgi:hypothetical protein
MSDRKGAKTHCVKILSEKLLTMPGYKWCQAGPLMTWNWVLR